jgi:hypothetical protein
MLPVFHARWDLLRRRAGAFQLGGDEHPRQVRHSLQPLAQKRRGGPLLPPPLDQNGEPVAVLIQRAPEIRVFTVAGEKARSQRIRAIATRKS